MPVPPLTVRPVVHTEGLPGWLAALHALGGRTLTDDPLWTEVELDNGRVTLTRLNRDALEGDVVLGFETPDLTSYADSLTGPVPTWESCTTDDYTSLRVRAGDGLELLVDEPPVPAAPSPAGLAATVLAEWTTPDVGTVVRDLEALGLVPMVGQAGLLQAGAGEVLVTQGDGVPRVDLAVLVSDLDLTRTALDDAGIAYDAIDGALLVRPAGSGSLLRVVRL